MRTFPNAFHQNPFCAAHVYFSTAAQCSPINRHDIHLRIPCQSSTIRVNRCRASSIGGGGISLPPSERCGRLETENKLNLKGNTLSLCSVIVSLSSLHRHSLLPTQSGRRKPQKRHPETALFGSLDWKYYPRSISGDTHALYNITSSPRNDFIFRTLSRSSSCQYSKRSSRWETLVGATVHSLFSSNRVVLTSCWSPPYSGSISFRKSSYSTWLSQRINFWRWWIHEFPWEFFNHLMLGWAY